ncbi:MAG: alpha/beta hydrolase [bacterium]
MLIQFLHRLMQLRYRFYGIENRRLVLERCTLHYYCNRCANPKGILIFLHGLGTSSSTWFRILPSFTDQYQCYAIDLPGFGLSSVNGKGWFTLLDHVQTVSAFCHALALESYTLIAHSLGGWIAMHHGVLNASRVDQLILLDTAGLWFEGIDELQTVFDIKSTRDTQRLLDRLWYNYPWYMKLFTPAVTTHLQKKNCSEFIHSISSSDLLHHEVSKLVCPVTVIWGEEDRLIPKSVMLMLQQLVPHLRSITIPKCGHIPQLERPKELNCILHGIFP